MIGWVDNIDKVTKDNQTFRTALWTGKHAQLTIMNIKVGEEIGNEIHPEVDQFIRIEQGKAKLTFGQSQDQVDEEHEVEDDWAFIIPAGTWHNVINTGEVDLKLYSIYSPPNHPDGTVHQTKADAEAAEAAEHAD